MCRNEAGLATRSGAVSLKQRREAVPSRSKPRPDRATTGRTRAAASRDASVIHSARTAAEVGAADSTLAFLRSLWALDHRLRSTSKRMERELGITAPQRLVLRLLGRSPGLTPSLLAEALHLDRGTLSGVLERLVERELVAREPHPEDGRSVRLQLTVRGRRFDREAPGTVEHGVQRALQTLSPAQIATAREVLDAICSALDVPVRRAPPRRRAR